MATILCYGDSLTWGSIPNGGRYQKHCRWPEMLNKQLGDDYDVINFGLPGRTTIWDDPFVEGRNGIKYIQSAMETFGPVDIVIVMLGTNDLKQYFNANAYNAAKGVEKIITKIREPNIYNFPAADIIVVAPPNILSPKGEAADIFMGATEKTNKFHQEYQKVTARQKCVFLNAAGIIKPSEIDGVHLDIDANTTLSQALAPLVRNLSRP